MPTKTKASAVTAAIEEVTAPPAGMVTFTYAGESYEYKRKRLGSPQWRATWQTEGEMKALAWLLGRDQLTKFLTTTADEDGVTPDEDWIGFLAAIGDAVGAGN